MEATGTSELLSFFQAAVAVREAAMARVRPCPSCGEEHQIQLTAYLGGITPEFKCRTCKTRFEALP
jgi:transposase-like protein